MKSLLYWSMDSPLHLKRETSFLHIFWECPLWLYCFSRKEQMMHSRCFSDARDGFFNSWFCGEKVIRKCNKGHEFTTVLNEIIQKWILLFSVFFFIYTNEFQTKRINQFLWFHQIDFSYKALPMLISTTSLLNHSTWMVFVKLFLSMYIFARL